MPFDKEDERPASISEKPASCRRAGGHAQGHKSTVQPQCAPSLGGRKSPHNNTLTVCQGGAASGSLNHSGSQQFPKAGSKAA
ncbi:MAG TPA: hypothetical protein DCS74_05090 [Veillonellaceae bacterium]|nr:hypothetical protein [Veillonellaceae bacterium]